MTTPDELAERLLGDLDERLAAADAELAADYPGERPGRRTNIAVTQESA